MTTTSHIANHADEASPSAEICGGRTNRECDMQADPVDVTSFQAVPTKAAYDNLLNLSGHATEDATQRPTTDIPHTQDAPGEEADNAKTPTQLMPQFTT